MFFCHDLSCYNSLLLEAEPSASPAATLMAGGICSWCPIPTGKRDSLHFHLQCETLCLVTAALGEKSVLWEVVLHSFQACTFKWDVWLCRRRANLLLSAGKFVVPKLVVLWRCYPSTVGHCCKDEWHVPAHSHAGLGEMLGFPIYHIEFSEQCFPGVLVPFCFLLLFSQLTIYRKTIAGLSSFLFLKSLLPLHFLK